MPPSEPPAAVLLVDDSPTQRMLRRRLLDSLPGFRVVGEASDGLEAVRWAKELQPDIVLLDLVMGGLDGVAALPHLLRASPRSRVIVDTGEREGDLATRCRELGAFDFVEKGAPPDKLLESLRRAREGR